jgi:hypothetical protein
MINVERICINMHDRCISVKAFPSAGTPCVGYLALNVISSDCRVPYRPHYDGETEFNLKQAHSRASWLSLRQS